MVGMVGSRYLVESDAEGAFQYVTQFYGLDWSRGQKGIVLRRDGEIIAAALYVEFNGTNIFLHVAGSPGRPWLTREFMYWCFHYPFVQLGCKRMTAWIESNNAASIRFAEKTGWTREAVLAGAGKDGVDAYVYRILREECKYV